jgi:predicted DNA-binding transcriptional regulator AlpA
MWLNPTRASAKLGVSRRTVYNYMKMGKLTMKQNIANTGRLVWVPDDYNQAPKAGCDCHNHKNQVCDICQNVTGKEKDK